MDWAPGGEGPRLESGHWGSLVVYEEEVSGGDKLEIRPLTSCGSTLEQSNPLGSLPLPARVGVGVKGQLGRPLGDPVGQVVWRRGCRRT